MNAFVSRIAAPAMTPLALALASTFVFAPTFASAQQAQPAQDVVITAARMAQSAREVLTDHLVIGAEELERAGQSTLADLLQKQRGIEVSRTGGPGNTASVFIRGASNAQSIVLVDGVRVGSSTIGGATWETIPVSQIERVEIVYGPMSSLYGADAIGGVIQVFTKQGDGPARLSAAAGSGKWGARQLEAGVSGGAKAGSGTFRYALQAAHEQTDGFSASLPGAGAFTYNADRDGMERDSVSGRFSFDYLPGHEVGLSVMNSRLDVQFDGGPTYDDRMVQRLQNTALFARNRFSPSWTSHVQFARSADKGHTDASWGKSDINTTQDLFSWQNDIAVGADTVQLIAERRVEEVDPASAAQAGRRTTNSFAATYQLRRGDHLGTAAVRHDRNSQFGSHTSGNVAWGWFVTKALRVNASVGTSFRAPTFNDLYFPGYGVASNRPEEGRNAELGLHYREGSLNASAVYYRNRLTDLLTYLPVCPVEQATHRFGCAYNVNEALLTGLSMSSSVKLGNLSLRGALDLQDPRDETTGKKLARRARRHGSLGADYAFGAWKAGAELVFSGERFDDAANRNRLGGYGVVNLTGGYDFGNGLSAHARWNNVADKQYALARNYRTPDSNLFVGLRYTTP